MAYPISSSARSRISDTRANPLQLLSSGRARPNSRPRKVLPAPPFGYSPAALPPKRPALHTARMVAIEQNPALLGRWNSAAGFKPIRTGTSELSGVPVSSSHQFNGGTLSFSAAAVRRHDGVAVVQKLQLQFLEMTLEAIFHMLQGIVPSVVARGD